MNGFRGVKTIVSGGQTGVDRAALDFALECGINIGGRVPKGRLAEDGPIPARYPNLVETESPDPEERTMLNINESDATLIISRGRLAGGSRLTADIARNLGRPFLHIDLEAQSINEAARHAARWLDGINCTRLNIAGPRASEDPAIYGLTLSLLDELFK